MFRNKQKWIQSWEDLAYHRRGKLLWLSPILFPASILYGGIQKIRRGFYQAGIIKGIKVSIPVISIGNLTVGGVGKTPFALFLAQTLTEMGYKPAILFRGYKRQSGEAIILTKEIFDPKKINEYGDEPAMVCHTSGIPCGIYRLRSETAQSLINQNLCDILLMDDGFQHLQLQRDLDLILLDGENTVGNSNCLPMGPLREPLKTLKHAHAIIIRGNECQSITQKIPNNPTFTGSLVWQGLCPFLNWSQGSFSSVIPVAQYHSQSVILVSGIGNPVRLEEQAISHGLQIALHVRYPDHHWITHNEIVQAAAFDHSMPILLTEKDAIRLLRMVGDLPPEVLKRLVVIQAAWQMHDNDLFLNWLKSSVKKIQQNKV